MNVRVNSRTIDWRGFLLSILVAGIPNVAFSVTAILAGLSRPWLNIDYAVAGLLLGPRWRIAGIGVFAAAVLVDGAYLVGQVFPFVRISDLFHISKILPFAPFEYQAAFAVTLLALVAMLVFTIRVSKRIAPLPALAVFNAFLVAWLVEITSGGMASQNRTWLIERHGVADSAMATFVLHRVVGNGRQVYGNGSLFSPYEKERASTWLRVNSGEESDRILLIVAESFGLFVDERVNEAITEPLASMEGRGVEEFESGEIPFSNYTVAGELRELCGLRPNHLNLRRALEDELVGCIPHVLRARGFRTEARHGAIGSIYDRMHWYRKAGFDGVGFDGEGRWRTRCYSFPGACDHEILESDVIGAFRQTGKVFMYWLTLNSHAVYDVRDIRDAWNCATVALSVGSEACRMAQLHRQLFSDLADVIGRGELDGVEVLIVGDHPPPRFRRQDREQVREGVVRWVRFRTDGLGTQ